MIRVIDKEFKRVGEWVCERIEGIYTTGGPAIGLERDGKLEAGVLYEGFTGSSIQMHVAIDGRMTPSFLWYSFYYPFNELKVKKIIGIVPAWKPDVLAFDKNIGFVEAFTIEDYYPLGAAIILTMTPSQCRFLGKRYELRCKQSQRPDIATA